MELRRIKIDKDDLIKQRIPLPKQAQKIQKHRSDKRMKVSKYKQHEKEPE